MPLSQTATATRPLVTTYLHSPKVIWGVAISVTVIGGGILGYMYFTRPVPTPTPQPTVTVTPTPTPTPINYNGTYKGNTSVASGLAKVTMKISGTKVTGSATYNGRYNGYPVTAPITIKGIVSETGAISAGLSASGTLYGAHYYFSGSLSGQIAGRNISCSYTLSGNYGSYKGKVTMKKQ